MRGRKKPENKLCFLCLTTSESFNCGSGDNGDISLIKPDIKILLQYLLDTRNPKYDQLIKEIVGIPSQSPTISVNLCEKCGQSTKIIGDLHKSLELLQLKLIHQLKLIKLKILNEVQLKTKSTAADHIKSSKNLKEILPLFHQGVQEKDNLGVSIPLIFLQKYSPPPHTSLQTQVTGSEDDQPPQTEKNTDVHLSPIIKTESPTDLFDNDNLSDSHFDDLWNQAPTKLEDICSKDSDYIPPPPIPKLKLNRKSKSTTFHRISSKTTNPPPKKRPRKTKTNKNPDPPPPKRPRGRPRLHSTKPKPKPRPSRAPRVRHPLLCLLCPYKTLYPFKFEQHLRSHEQNPPSPTSPLLPCPSCPSTFSLPQSLQFHIEGHSSPTTPNPRSLICDHCFSRIPYSELPSHMSSHSPPLPKIFPCPHCSFSSSTRPKFLCHLKIHGKGHLPCDICPLTFTLPCKLLEHLHKAHQAIEKIPCDFPHCTKAFYDPLHLKVHQNIHVNPYSCTICGKVFTDDYKLKVHLRAHTGERPFKCEECEDVSFTSKACLIRHQIKKHGRSKYKCEYCDKEYGDMGMLKVHLIIHEGGGLPCGKCDKVLGNKSLWKRHQLVHSEKKEVICDECGKGFKCDYALKLHKQSHKGDGDKGWICKVCGKAFVIKKYLMDHERTHTGERPFVCSMCGKAFSQHGSLCMHYKKFHPGQEKKTESAEEKMKGKKDNDRGEMNCEQVVFKEDNFD